MAFKLKHQNGSPFHQQNKNAQTSNRLSDDEFNKQFNEGQIFQGGQDVDVGSTERNVSKGAGFPTGASPEKIKEWYVNNPRQGDTLSAAKDDAFESDGFFRQAGTFLSNPFQGTRAAMNQMSYNHVTDEFGTNDTNPAFTNLTNLRKAKKASKFGTLPGDEMNAVTQAASFALGGGVKGLAKGVSKIPAAINAAKNISKSGKVAKFANSLTNPLTAGTFADALSGNYTAIAAKYLPELLKTGGTAKEIAKKAYYAYKGGKIQPVKELFKSGAKGAMDLGTRIANASSPETSPTGLENAYAQMGQGMQAKTIKEGAIDEATKKDAVAETNKDNLIMRGS
jgi:hypothetical protein